MAFIKAGLWGPQAIIDSSGHPQPGAAAALYLPDEVTLASLWTTSAKSVVMANPTQADIHANLHFWTDPGQYRLRVNVGTVVTWLDVEVPIDPGEAAQDQDVMAAQAAAEAYADGIVAAALAASQPLDADLTAIAALATTAFGRALLILADAAALRTAAGLGTAATHASTDFDAAGTAAAAVAALVAGAPGALDTLNELATALADDASFATTVTNALAAKSPILNPTAVKTGNYTAAATDYVLCDTSGGIFTVTLPTAPADKTSIAVDLVASGNTLTIARGGADVFQKTGGPTSLTMNTANRVLVFQYQSATAVWHVQDHLPAVINTKGDLLTYGTERARLPVGADGALLGADSTQTIGLKWIPSGTYALPDVVVSKTANYTAHAGEYVLCDTTSGGFTVTLPATPSAGQLVGIKKSSSDGNVVTISPNVDGGTITIATQNHSLFVEYDGSAWRGRSGHYPKNTFVVTAPVAAGGSQVVAPNMATNSLFAVGVTDAAGNNGQLIQVDHNGAGSTAYGIEVINRPGAASGFVVHQYSSLNAAIVLDNTDFQTGIVLRNTENQTRNPGHQGTGNYVDWYGYDGNEAGGLAAVKLMASLGKALIFKAQASTAWQFTTAGSPNATATRALVVSQPSGSTGIALDVSHAGDAVALNVQQSGPHAAVNVVAQAGAAGHFALSVSGQDYGPQFSTTTDSGITLSLSKAGTGTGDVLYIDQAGTGSSMRVKQSGVDKFSMDPTGDSHWYGSDGNIRVEHKGSSTGLYGVEIHNRPSFSSALAIHQYSSAAAALVMDNTDSQTAILIRNTENSSLNPGHHGTGTYLDIYDYLARTNYADGVTTSGSAVLTSASAAFVAADAGKTITGTGIPASTTILSVDSATQVTMSANATATGSGVAFQLHRLANVGVAGSIQNVQSSAGVPNLTFKGKNGVGFTFTTDNTGGVPLAVSNASGSNVQAFTVTQAAAQNAIRITHSGAKEALVVSATGNSGLYTQIVTTTQNFGLQLVTTTDSGMVLSVEKNGTGAGVAAQIINKGTGLSLDVRSASASLWGLTAAGLPKWVAAGNVQTTVGAAGAASALPGAPSKYLKVVGDDGVTYVIPAYLAA